MPLEKIVAVVLAGGNKRFLSGSFSISLRI
jgi:hypothetical protein